MKNYLNAFDDIDLASKLMPELSLYQQQIDMLRPFRELQLEQDRIDELQRALGIRNELSETLSEFRETASLLGTLHEEQRRLDEITESFKPTNHAELFSHLRKQGEIEKMVENATRFRGTLAETGLLFAERLNLDRIWGETSSVMESLKSAYRAADTLAEQYRGFLPQQFDWDSLKPDNGIFIEPPSLARELAEQASVIQATTAQWSELLRSAVLANDPDADADEVLSAIESEVGDRTSTLSLADLMKAIQKHVSLPVMLTILFFLITTCNNQEQTEQLIEAYHHGMDQLNERINALEAKIEDQNSDGSDRVEPPPTE